PMSPVSLSEPRSPLPSPSRAGHHDALPHDALAHNALAHNALPHNALPHNALTPPPDSAGLLDRAYKEYCRLAQAGSPPDVSEFCKAFPQIENSLAIMLSVHRHVHEDEQFLERPDVRWPEAGESFLGFQIERQLGRGAFSR